MALKITTTPGAPADGVLMEPDAYGELRAVVQLPDCTIESSLGDPYRDPIVARIRRPDGEGIRTTNGRGDDTHVDVASDGTVTYTVLGDPPQGETGVDQVARELAKHLQHLGSIAPGWSVTVSPAGDACDCAILDGAGKELRGIQVVRPPAPLWKVWGRPGAAGARATMTVNEIADGVGSAVRAKATKYPADVKAALALAVDAVRLAGHAALRVIEALASRHGSLLRETGFAEVWVVGPAPDLVWRIDR